MTTLILDSSGPYAVLSVASENGDVLSSLTFEASRTLSTRLFAGIESVLSSAGLGKESISGLAVGTGPGSFTGVRIALTTFRTMAQAMDVPLVGISSLDAYAEPLLAISSDRAVVVVLPSRRGEVYAAVYRDGLRVAGPLAESPEAFRERVASLSPAVVCGRTETAGDLGAATVIETRCPSPDALARLAAKRLLAGNFDSPINLLPEYVVEPVITTPRDPNVLSAVMEKS